MKRDFVLKYWDEVTDHVITGNYGVDFSTLIKKLEKGDL